MTMQALALDHFSLTVDELEAAIAFYEDVAGFEHLYTIGPFDARELPPVDDADWTAAHVDVADARLRLAALRAPGDGVLELVEYERPAETGHAVGNSAPGGRHLAIRVADLASAAAHLQARGATLMAGPVSIDEGPCAGLRFRYARDPFGNYIELVQYESQAWMDGATAG